MGKRELLLIVGFIIIGTIVYQATADPPGPNERGLSLGRLVEAARREIRGNQSSIDLTTTTTFPLTPDISEIRVTGYVVDVQITGTNRQDVEAILKVNSRGYNDEEAKRFGEATVLKADPAGTSLALRIQYPTGRDSGRQRATLVLAMPHHLRARIESRPGQLSVANIAAIEIGNAGGETKIKDITGRATLTQRGGTIHIDNVASLKLSARSAEVALNGVAGDASISMDQGGELKASGIVGPLDLDTRNADVTLENLETTRGPIRVNAANGTVVMKGVRSEARVDGRNAEIDISMSAPAPITIYSEGERVSLTPPAAGFRLDAIVVEGRIAPEAVIKSLGLQIAAEDAARESRVIGAVGGGGPTITLRATRADFTLRERDAATPAAPASSSKPK